LLFDSLGSSRMYLIAAMVAWSGVLLFTLGTLRIRKKEAI
jgi:hypothetical protein